jgi:DNA-binding PadR family transcriptional regulator
MSEVPTIPVGQLDIAVLAMVNKNEEVTGYAIRKEAGIAFGSVFPILHSLASMGLVTKSKATIPRFGPKRLHIYYTITEKGKKALREKLEDIRKFERWARA